MISKTNIDLKDLKDTLRNLEEKERGQMEALMDMMRHVDLFDRTKRVLFKAYKKAFERQAILEQQRLQIVSH